MSGRVSNPMIDMWNFSWNHHSIKLPVRHSLNNIMIISQFAWSRRGSYFSKQDQDLSLGPDKFEITLKPALLQLHCLKFCAKKRTLCTLLSTKFQASRVAILQILE